MKYLNKKRIIGLLVVICFAIGAIFITTTSQTQKLNQQQEVREEIPIVNFNAPEPKNAQEREIRKIRGQKYNTGSPLKDTVDLPFELLQLPLSHAPVKSAIPVAQSDAVVIGTVTEAKAFLSSDKSYVYSEFTISVEDVFKNFSSAALAPNTTTILERSGGKVRFSSGKTQRLGNSGEGLPQRQKRYVFFLKWSEQGKDFLILNGYELKDGKVILLDGNRENELSIYRNYKPYENRQESDFLKLVKAAIADPHEEVPTK